MIVYQLACERGHYFEGWFASAEACEKQAVDGRLQCPSCASANVRKLPAAPHVRTSASDAPQLPVRREEARREALVALRTLILASTQDVGRQFAEVARRIHYKEEEARNIRGRVTQDEAEELREEGIQALVVSPEVLPSEEIH